MKGLVYVFGNKLINVMKMAKDRTQKTGEGEDVVDDEDMNLDK